MKFGRVSKEYWNDVSNQRSFLDELAKKLNITRLEGWYKITPNVLRLHGGESIMDKHDQSLYKVLSTVYPGYPIEFTSENTKKRLFQDILGMQIVSK